MSDPRRIGDPEPETWGVAANVVNDKVLRTGAKVLILDTHGNPVSAKVLGLAKNGHSCTKYIKTRRLKNFRPTFVPKHQADLLVNWRFSSKEKAAEVAESWNAKDPNGTDRERMEPDNE